MTEFRMLAFSLLILVICSATSCGDRDHGLDLSIYQYRDTRDLVRFVFEAAEKIETRGSDFIDYLREHRDRYRTESYYLYVYDTNAVALFHAGMPYLEGRDLRDVVDIDGKNIFSMILQALADPCNPHGWIHYSWWSPGSFYPVPKSSCHFLAVTADGDSLIVGAGVDYPLEEKEFTRIAVDNAASRLELQGEGAAEEIGDPSSIYSFRDVRVFAFKSDGTMLISPVIESGISHADLMQATDPAGNRPFALAVTQLRSEDSCWQVFMARDRYQRQLVKKVLYLRRMITLRDTVYIGAITDMPMTP